MTTAVTISIQINIEYYLHEVLKRISLSCRISVDANSRWIVVIPEAIGVAEGTKMTGTIGEIMIVEDIDAAVNSDQLHNKLCVDQGVMVAFNWLSCLSALAT